MVLPRQLTPVAKKTSDERYLVPAVEQASRILFCLARAGASHLSLTEICAQVGIHKSKAFSILETLQRFGLVQRNTEGKGYALGPGLVSLSRKVLDDLSPPRLAQPILEDLAEKAGSTAILGLIVDRNIFVAAKHEGEGNIGVTMRIGNRLPLAYGAHGKAIAAFLPGKERDSLLQGGDLHFHGDPAKLDRLRLQRELAQCRRKGFAEDLGELNRGLNVVAAPVLGPNRAPIGFVEILVLFSAKAAHRLGPLVAEAGKTLSRQLGAEVDETGDDLSLSSRSGAEKKGEIWQSKRQNKSERDLHRSVV
jgi:DNA-binding IclR family transcriptional regulator